MSEYQYYEWQTIDQPLTEKEQAAVEKLSSHIEVSPTQAIVTYSWSDFSHNPKEVLLKYFDAFLYMANWGSQQLMFRFPTGVLDPEIIQPYCRDYAISFTIYDDYDILDIEINDEEGGEWIEGEGNLSGLLSLRNDLIQGDYRLLYLAWLKAISQEDPEEVEDELEPPVPGGLKELNSALKRFIKIFGGDNSLIQIAAETSPEPRIITDNELKQAVSQLSRQECDDYLLGFAKGEPGLYAKLHQRLMTLIGGTSNAAGTQRTLGQLMKEVGRRKSS